MIKKIYKGRYYMLVSDEYWWVFKSLENISIIKGSTNHFKINLINTNAKNSEGIKHKYSTIYFNKDENDHIKRINKSEIKGSILLEEL